MRSTRPTTKRSVFDYDDIRVSLNLQQMDGWNAIVVGQIDKPSGPTHDDSSGQYWPSVMLSVSTGRLPGHSSERQHPRSSRFSVPRRTHHRITSVVSPRLRSKCAVSSGSTRALAAAYCSSDTSTILGRSDGPSDFECESWVFIRIIISFEYTNTFCNIIDRERTHVSRQLFSIRMQSSPRGTMSL